MPPVLSLQWVCVTTGRDRTFPISIIGMRHVFAAYPTRLRASTERSSQWYTQLPGYFAVHGKLPKATKTRIAYVLEEDNIVICRGDPADLDDGTGAAVLSPVYALEPDSPPAVPTGSIFVRFVEGMPVAGQREHLLRAGYSVYNILSYAPNAAWLRDVSGGIAPALSNIQRLEAVPGIVNVEPQMLFERVTRRQDG